MIFHGLNRTSESVVPKQAACVIENLSSAPIRFLASKQEMEADWLGLRTVQSCSRLRSDIFGVCDRLRSLPSELLFLKKCATLFVKVPSDGDFRKYEL